MVTIALVFGVVLAVVLRRSRLKWTWAVCGLPAAYLRWNLGGGIVAVGIAARVVAGMPVGAGWHRGELDWGADIAERARHRAGSATSSRAPPAS